MFHLHHFLFAQHPDSLGRPNPLRYTMGSLPNHYTFLRRRNCPDGVEALSHIVCEFMLGEWT